MGKDRKHRGNGVLPAAAANESMGFGMTPQAVDGIEKDVAVAVKNLLVALRIGDDHNTRDTPDRVARMYVRELMAGRFEERPRLTDFPNAKHVDQIYVVGPVSFVSMCAHHLCPIEGVAHIGVIPSNRVIGLSKFTRLTRWIMARPQIQEEATMMLADEIELAIKPRALGVIVNAKHGCMTLRGVRDDHSRMTTSEMRGLFRRKHTAKMELMELIRMQGGFRCEP